MSDENQAARPTRTSNAFKPKDGNVSNNTFRNKDRQQAAANAALDASAKPTIANQAKDRQNFDKSPTAGMDRSSRAGKGFQKSGSSSEQSVDSSLSGSVLSNKDSAGDTDSSNEALQFKQPTVSVEDHPPPPPPPVHVQVSACD